MFRFPADLEASARSALCIRCATLPREVPPDEQPAVIYFWDDGDRSGWRVGQELGQPGVWASPLRVLWYFARD